MTISVIDTYLIVGRQSLRTNEQQTISVILSYTKSVIEFTS